MRAPQARILEAILVTCGERGYESTSVRDVIERARASRATFYKHFDDKEDCFVRAYRDAAEWSAARVLGAARRQEGWREGLRAGLAELLDLCVHQPAIAKAMIVEAHSAGGVALEHHDRLLAQFAEGLDKARDSLPRDKAPPPTTAIFVVGAVETMLREKLLADEATRIPEMLPTLVYFAVMQYFGEEAAWEDMAAAPLASWDSRRRAAAASAPG